MPSTFTVSNATLAAGTFSPPHIPLTAGLTAVLALAAGTLLKVRGPDLVAVTALTFAATWLLRRSANMPALNDGGLPGFSANDCLAPAVTWVDVALYSDLRRQPAGAALRRTRAAAALLTFAVNVLTI
jgi:hypothetical protein